MADKFIDIERVIGDKNPKLLKRLPRFVIRYLKRILHEDEVNEIIEENKGVDGIQFCHNVIKRFNITTIVEGVENIPLTGGATFASNHPLGGMDALAFVDIFSAYRTDVKFVANDILMNIEPMQSIFVGVNKHGRNALESRLELDRTLASNQSVVIFPAGLVSRKRRGRIEDLDWKKTFVTRAKKHDIPIIPVYIEGRLTNFFYHLSNVRELLGIKANIEMLYLVDELFRQKNKTIRIIFGKPIPASELDSSKKDVEWAQEIKRTVYDLANRN